MPTWTAADIPDQKGRTAVVTGANAGLGFQIARELARHGAHTVLGCRDAGRGGRARDRILAELPGADVELASLDLADLASVRRFADAFGDRPLHVLVNNAGVTQGRRREVTADGFERMFGTNHLGHFALTGLLLPALLGTPGPRAVTMGGREAPWARPDLDAPQSEP